MIDTVLTLAQLENLMQSITSQILNTTDPSAVRVSWPQNGAPSWHITDDVCFIRVTYRDDPYTRQMMIEYEQANSLDSNVSTTYTAVINVMWYLYGPNSFNHADLIRAYLFQDNYTQLFGANSLALITDVSMPSRIPELFNGQWWDRSTLTANFNQLVIRNSTVPYLQSANVQVNT